jgi:hypothetical protein
MHAIKYNGISLDSWDSDGILGNRLAGSICPDTVFAVGVDVVGKCMGKHCLASLLHVGEVEENCDHSIVPARPPLVPRIHRWLKVVVVHVIMLPSAIMKNLACKQSTLCQALMRIWLEGGCDTKHSVSGANEDMAGGWL